MHTCQGKYQVRNDLICFNCNKPGHLAKFCWNRDQHFHKYVKSVQCFTCHKCGHTSRECWHRIDNLVHAPMFHVNVHKNKDHVHAENTQKFYVHEKGTVAQKISSEFHDKNLNDKSLKNRKQNVQYISGAFYTNSTKIRN